MKWYFEFNDDRFCLKLEQNSDDLDAVAQYAEKCTALLKEDRRFRPKRGSTWKRGWPLLGDWEVDFSDFEKAEKTMNEIISTYGASGVMGRL